jgi:hypothetical protein
VRSDCGQAAGGPSGGRRPVESARQSAHLAAAGEKAGTVRRRPGALGVTRRRERTNGGVPSSASPSRRSAARTTSLALR